MRWTNVQNADDYGLTLIDRSGPNHTARTVENRIGPEDATLLQRRRKSGWFFQTIGFAASFSSRQADPSTSRRRPAAPGFSCT
jgi:hypothetical protein